MPAVTGLKTAPAVAGFAAQQHRPLWWRDTAFTGLSACHRLLVVNDGRTVPLIEAMTLEHTRVRCLSQHPAAADNPLLRWLQPRPGENPVARQVLIEGHRSGALYVYAASVFIASRLPTSCPPLRIGIGAALAGAGVATRRELLWWGRTGGSVASRAYRIVADEKPLFVVCEDFLR